MLTLLLLKLTYAFQINITQFVVRQCIMIVGGSLLFALRWYIMGASTPVFQQVDNPASFAESLLVRVSNMKKKIFTNCDMNIKLLCVFFFKNKS